MKKIKSLLFILIAILLIISIPNSIKADDTKYTTSSVINGRTIQWEYQLNDSNEIINLKCLNSVALYGDITIPSTLDGKTVRSIGNNGFVESSFLTGVTIPDTIKEIDYSAFKDCKFLTRVDLGRIEKLSFDVFKGCDSLTSIEIPNTLKESALSEVFTNCTNLKHITFEEGLTKIPQYLCATTGIEEVVIPDSVKEIDYRAFKDCKSLSRVDLGNLETISFDVFMGCDSLQSIVIPNTLVNGSDYPIFTDCINLTNITFEEGTTVLAANICATTGISHITIPNTVVKIEREAFDGCKKLVSITIPESVKDIEYKAFYNCTLLSNVDLGRIEKLSFDIFKGCDSLESIEIPNTLKESASSEVFTNCTNLKHITFEEGLTKIPQYLCATTGIEEIVIPDSVKEIGYCAFKDCKSLSNVNLGKIETISFDVFKGCSSLESIVIPKTLKNTPSSEIFTNCTNLKDMTFEEGITKIPKYICTSTGVEEIIIPNSATQIEYSAFKNCSKLKKITIPKSVTKMGFYPSDSTDTVFNNHSSDLTIYCYKDSVAHKYAVKYNINYVILPEDITFNKSVFNLKLGDILRILASILPDEAADFKITWESSDPTIVSVDEEGNITANGNGEVQIIATVENIVKQVVVFVREYRLGDLNDDGFTNITDSTLILKYLKGIENFTEEQIKAGDLNFDGTINITDYTMYIKYLKGMEEF